MAVEVYGNHISDILLNFKKASKLSICAICAISKSGQVLIEIVLGGYKVFWYKGLLLN